MKNIFLVIMVLFLSACFETKNIPEYVLPKETMVTLLIDIHILENKIQSLRLKNDSSQVLYNTFERELFKEHQIEQQVYKRSFEYYLEDVREMTEIYDIVIDSLNLREKSVNTKLSPKERNKIIPSD